MALNTLVKSLLAQSGKVSDWRLETTVRSVLS